MFLSFSVHVNMVISIYECIDLYLTLTLTLTLIYGTSCRRYRLRGALHIVFYALPELPHLYSELVSLLVESHRHEWGEQTSALSLYTSYDGEEVQRVMGHDRSDLLIHSDKHSFVFTWPKVTVTLTQTIPIWPPTLP